MKNAPFIGQWIGKFMGNSTTPENANNVFPGSAIFSIELDKPTRGFACIDQGNQIHGSRKDFQLNFDGNNFSGKAMSTVAFDYETSEPISVEESIQRQKQKRGVDIFYLTELALKNGFIDDQKLACNWTGTHAGHRITGQFEAHKLNQAKIRKPDKTLSWLDFKQFIGETINGRTEPLFRGQSSSRYKLKTTFHRERRYDLLRYERDACSRLVQHINAISSRQYDLKNSSDFGALLSLVQHHGFPTPLLDWSKSPYIAAFFALEKRCLNSDEDDNPRIYVLDAVNWRADTTQVTNIADPRPTITPLEFSAQNNPRHLPQQSVHTYTNIEDLEDWIRIVETNKGKRYLTTIDIPRSERDAAMRDLTYMGVNASTLFPGLEGVCRFMKEEFLSSKITI